MLLCNTGKEMKGFKRKTGLILGIVILLVTTCIPCESIRLTHTITPQKNITITSQPSAENTSSLTVYVMSDNGLEKQNMHLTISELQKIYEKYQELKKEMTSNPYSDKTRRTQQEFIDFLIEHNAIPAALSKDQLFSLTQPPVQPIKHLPRGILPFALGLKEKEVAPYGFLYLPDKTSSAMGMNSSNLSLVSNFKGFFSLYPKSVNA